MPELKEVLRIGSPCCILLPGWEHKPVLDCIEFFVNILILLSQSSQILCRLAEKLRHSLAKGGFAKLSFELAGVIDLCITFIKNFCGLLLHLFRFELLVAAQHAQFFFNAFVEEPICVVSVYLDTYLVQSALLVVVSLLAEGEYSRHVEAVSLLQGFASSVQKVTKGQNAPQNLLDVDVAL